jgi:integrase
VAKRRGRGEGSVYRRKDGRCVGEYRDAAGRKRYVSGKTITEVKRKLRQALADRDQGISPEPQNLSLGKYLDCWLDSVEGTVRPGTFRRYEESVRLHVKPALGSIRLGNLNFLHLQELYRTKLDSGLSPRTVQIIHRTVFKALKQATRWNLIHRNVAQMVDAPKVPKREVKPLTTEQVSTLLQAAAGDRLEALYVLAIATGMRCGELLGLKWEDIDLELEVLRVRRSVYNGVVSPPKTGHSLRSIRIPATAIEALRKHGRESEWVFCDSKGTPIGYHNLIRRYWKPLLRKAGLPDSTRFHDLRHTTATLLLAQNVNPRLVQQLLGHSTVSFTLDRYSHFMPGMGDVAASAMDEVLGL